MELCERTPGQRAVHGIFTEFDANMSFSIDFEEFVSHLHEPRERRPLFRRMFDAGTRTRRATTTRSTRSSSSSGSTRSAALPRGDFLLKFLWDLYDPELKGWVRDEQYRQMLREVMCADLPDELKRQGDDDNDLDDDDGDMAVDQALISMGLAGKNTRAEKAKKIKEETERRMLAKAELDSS